MIEGAEYKRNFLSILNRQKAGWINGDAEHGPQKKADIVNHGLKICIEIKDDTKYKIIADGMVRTTDLKLMNQRFGDDVNSANSK